jgi:hypothetical protein
MWPRRKADELLEEMIRENGLAEEGDTAAPRQQRFSLFGSKRKLVPFTARPSAQSRDRRGDLTIAALGVTLGLICALFPWYIFFNPEEFGVRAVKFGGSGPGTEPIVLGAQPDRVGAPVASQDITPLELDLRTTGTASQEPEDEDGTPGLIEQPFPAPVASFRLVQIANGRAMIEDDTGLFIVEPGSVLPDSTRVRSIEQRDGRPVLITESGTVLEISE